MCRSMMLIVLLALGATCAESAGTLALTWSDCGDSSTHGKVSDLAPLSLALGEKTTITGTGSLNEAVTAGTFNIDLAAGPIKQKFTGDMCTSKTFSLPLGTGSITWDGVKCPMAVGTQQIPVDMLLSSILPPILQKTELTITMTSSSGDKLMCLDIHSAPATLPQVQIQDVERTTGVLSKSILNAGSLKLAFTDCGSTHGKVSDLQPRSLALGQKTTITGSGSLDEALTAGTFEIDMTAGPIKQKFTGDICAAKTFNLPLGTGSITWDGLKCPLAAGDQQIPIDMLLSKVIPSMLETTTLVITVASASDAKLICMQVNSAPALSAEASTETQVTIQDIERTTGILSKDRTLAGSLKLAFNDCADSSTHGKVTDLQPTSLALGQTTTITGSGSLNEAVTAGTFTIDMTAGPIKQSFAGDICAAKSFGLPLGTGKITWDGLKCPLAVGAQQIPVDMLLSSLIPSVLETTTLVIKMASSNGDKLMCLEIHSSPAAFEKTASILV